MDPRQPQQHPFSRNGASPYARNPPYTTPSSQPSYPPTSHAPSTNSNPPYAEHHRRPSDPHYSSYGQQRTYSGDGHMRDGPVRDAQAREGLTRDAAIREMRETAMREASMREGPMPGHSHSRHQSASSIGNRGMPPPSSPQQNSAHRYGQPPPARASASTTPVFAGGRELPALGTPQSHTPQMSIANLLGGSSSSREQPPKSYTPSTYATTQTPTYSSAHPSPRISTAPDYAPFRRPTTPEHARPYEPRDHRANSAGSPTALNKHFSPDAGQGRYRIPPAYGHRQASGDERREPSGRVTTSNSTAVPPRPSSQPGSYVPPRPADGRPVPNDGLFGRPARSGSLNRDSFRSEYDGPGHALSYSEKSNQQEREMTVRRERDREQREQHEQRQLRDLQEEREQREHRERVLREQQVQQDYAHQAAVQRSQAYSRPSDAREQAAWMRHGYEPPRPTWEPIPEQQPHLREPIPDYPRTTAPSHGSQPAHSYNESRSAGPSQQTSSAPQPAIGGYPPPFEIVRVAAAREKLQRSRMLQDQQRQAMYEPRAEPESAPTVAPTPYQHESPTRRPPLEDSQQYQQQQQQSQRSFLGVQEINRKGRISPLPQAVQGAQGQIRGPGSEPGIKSEFSRMFSGIGSGVGAMQSPINAGPQNIPNIGHMRREDLEGYQAQDSPTDHGLFGITRSLSRGGSRKKKLKEEDGRGDDESSTGRRTPGGINRGKRHKPHQHRYGHQHHHRVDPHENAVSSMQSNNSPFKNMRGAPLPSPPDVKATASLHHHHVVHRHHHHHATTPSKPEPPKNVFVPMPKRTVQSDKVLDAVAHLPRKHLGHAFYQSHLTPVGKTMNTPRSKLGFASTPEPLPRFEGSENSTFTIKVARVHLSDISRQEITSRKAVWGTDVYTDDSDVIAACIHQGWFKGQWSDDVDTSYLGLEIGEGPPEAAKDFLTKPPSTGPMDVPLHKDLHITVLILPTLEKYSGSVRFGLRSREWGIKRNEYKSEHDGLSFMIQSIRWVDGIDGSGGNTSHAKKKLNPVKLEEWEIEAEKDWSNRTLAQSKLSNDGMVIEESFVRGEGQPVFGDLTGIGTRSWWKRPAKKATPKQELVTPEVTTDPSPGKKDVTEVPLVVSEDAIVPTAVPIPTAPTLISADNAKDSVFGAPVSH